MTNTAAHECAFCGEDRPVRLLDYDGYAPDELICEDCFSHELASWDDLPEVKETA